MRAALITAAFAAAGCKAVEPAPTELDELIHFFWDEYDAGDPERLAEGIRNFHDVVNGDTLTEVMDGTHSSLSDEQVQVVGVNAEGAATLGLFMVNLIDCPFAGTEQVLLDPGWGDIYSVYDSYSRDFTSSADAWRQRSDEFITWDATYTTSVLTISYEADLAEGMRFLPAIDDEASPYGDAILFRRTMPEPAAFDSDNNSFTQDHKIELYYPLGDHTMHLHGMWREADFGLDMDNEGVQRLVLDGMKDWDDETEVACGQAR